MLPHVAPQVRDGFNVTVELQVIQLGRGVGVVEENVYRQLSNYVLSQQHAPYVMLPSGGDLLQCLCFDLL